MRVSQHLLEEVASARPARARGRLRPRRAGARNSGVSSFRRYGIASTRSPHAEPEEARCARASPARPGAGTRARARAARAAGDPSRAAGRAESARAAGSRSSIPRWFGSPVSAFGRKTLSPPTAPKMLIWLAPPVIGESTRLVEVDPESPPRSRAGRSRRARSPRSRRRTPRAPPSRSARSAATRARSRRRGTGSGART